MQQFPRQGINASRQSSLLDQPWPMVVEDVRM